MSPPPLILPATRMCEIRQRRPRQPISPIPGRLQGGSFPSLRPRTSFCHRPDPFTACFASTAKHHKCQSIATSGTTADFIAATRCVAVPELPNPVAAPALDTPVVLRSAPSLNIDPDNGAGCSSAPGIVPLTCQKRCWVHFSREPWLLFTCTSLSRLTGLCICSLPRMIHLSAPVP